MNDHTLVYRSSESCFHKGISCTEEQEKFAGEVTDEILQPENVKAQGKDLYFENFRFETTAQIALAVDDGCRLHFSGENLLAVHNDIEGANVAVLYSSGDLNILGEGKLTIDSDTSQGKWSRGVCARAGDLLIDGPQLEISAYRAKRSCCLYAGGRLWIQIGEKGKITIESGSLSLKAGSDVIRAAQGKLKIAAGAAISNCNETSGSAEEFCGSALSPIDREQPVTVSFSEEDR